MLFLREIVGHKQMVKTLLNAVSSGRVAHAYLFCGPEGVGKETTALAFARALLCSRPAEGDACGTCRECRQVESRNHPDLYFVQPSGNSIKIEQIRGIRRKCPYRPYQGGRKLFLIYQAETMTAEAANCLLKTLEEPPGDTVFILLSGRPQALPPTVLSRCQQLVFKGIPGPELIRELAGRHGLAEEVARLVAALAGGSMGRALAYASGSFQEERDEALELAEALGQSGPLEALEMAGKLSESKERAGTVLEMLACWYRDLLVHREAGETASLFNRDRREAVAAAAAGFGTGRLVEIIEEIEAAKNKIESSANARLALEALFLRLAGIAHP
ncbi:MAG: DNA polymerase III subunit delta' [Peptococcaceae bacterium]|nr:DNA polymerase III subunit delta' [Peptococcaceae bacterium]